MNKPLLKQALDALIDSLDDSKAVLAQHLENYGKHYRTERAQAMRQTVADVEAAITALEAELAKPDPEPLEKTRPPTPTGWSDTDWLKHLAVKTIPAPRGFIAQPSIDGVVRTSTTNCSRHPDAPHGFDRSASHSAGEYICECQSWQPGEAS